MGRDYTRIYIIGLSIIVLILLLVVATVPVHKDYVDKAIATLNTSPTKQTDADSKAIATLNSQLASLNKQIQDTQSVISLLRKDIISTNATATEYAALWQSTNGAVNSAVEEIQLVHRTINDTLAIVNQKPDKAQVDYLIVQLSNVTQAQASLILSLQHLYTVLNLNPVSGNATGN